MLVTDAVVPCLLDTLGSNGLTSSPQNLWSFAWRLSQTLWSLVSQRGQKIKALPPQQSPTNSGWKWCINTPTPHFLDQITEGHLLHCLPEFESQLLIVVTHPIMHPLLTGCHPFPLLVSSSLPNMFQDHLPNKLLLACKSTLRVSLVFHIIVSIYHHSAVSCFSLEQYLFAFDLY